MINLDDFLAHYGVKGMKWGVRKDRRSSSSSGTSKRRTTYQKAPSRLSDSELSKRIKRMELEKKYNDLNDTSTFNGRQYTQSLLENAGRTLVGAAVGASGSFFIQRLLKSKFGAN